MEPSSLNGVVRDLADKATRAVVVIDNCPSDAHRTLAGIVSRSTSKLSLITIDSIEDVTDQYHSDIHIVATAPPAVTDAIVDRELLGLPPEDRRRLVHFARGFPRIAMGVVGAWTRSTPLLMRPRTLRRCLCFVVAAARTPN